MELRTAAAPDGCSGGFPLSLAQLSAGCARPRTGKFDRPVESCYIEWKNNQKHTAGGMPAGIAKGAVMRRVLPIVLSFLLLCGCGAPAEESSGTAASTSYVFAMDTVMTLTVYGDEAFLDSAEAEILRLEALLSVTDADSDISRLNAQGTLTVDDTTLELLRRTLEAGQRTGGAMDPTAYSLVRLWGFTTEEYRVPSQEEIDAALATVDAGNVQIDGNQVTLLNGAQIDLGAVTKGYTGAVLAQMAEEAGVEAALFQLGGNVQVYGQKPDGSPWRIEIQDPFDAAGRSALLTLPADVKTMAVVTSGVYQRYFEEDGVRYHHIMDPETGAPADSGLVSVTIVCEDGFLADALSTALLVMGLEDATAFWRESGDFEAVFMDEAGALYVTEGLADAIEAESFTILGRDP